ncbi:Zn-ribbon domain-containing OB-fold protein [Haloarcula rubripromontorii]|uniref:Nucleic acid-binding protein n=1 Tax=Haloarcula rubripromontorii TaxID=1705562 RepID=A0A0M9AK23_9EURY|nr:nucleic acid-binding protein [Haloarcula rubripromontorii]KOX93058.1 nucleic acid-binding protein [Haloarcula rubripromontorii]NLV06593.1 nucleic acid-binding protein [Haloarcula rubripromontorii]
MTLEAGMCSNGHVSYPTHPLCPECGEPQEETFDLSDRTGEVVTWTHSTATPPGVREPNTLAIVEFDITDIDGASDEFVRALGQVTTDEVETGDTVEPVYVEELRDPDVGIKVPESQDWDGYRWDPV